METLLELKKMENIVLIIFISFAYLIVGISRGYGGKQRKGK
jgi:hypothetical protein